MTTRPMAALFDPEPAQWGLRGDPYVWQGMRERLRDTSLPQSAAEVVSVLHGAFVDIVGADPDREPAERVYREHLNHGGMSGGHVHLDSWRRRFMPMLVLRAVQQVPPVDEADREAVERVLALRHPPVVELVLGDITRQHVDAVVTAANESLRGGGGVDGAIHRAAGPELARAGAAIAPCRPGDAKVTPSFGLQGYAKHVIHTVGPVWRGGGHGEAQTLASCYRRSLQVADQVGAAVVAFPAIATGIYGFPADRAAPIAVHTVRTTPTAVTEVRLVAYDQPTHDLLRAALGT